MGEALRVGTCKAQPSLAPHWPRPAPRVLPKSAEPAAWPWELAEFGPASFSTWSVRASDTYSQSGKRGGREWHALCPIIGGSGQLLHPGQWWCGAEFGRGRRSPDLSWQQWPKQRTLKLKL